MERVIWKNHRIINYSVTSVTAQLLKRFLEGALLFGRCCGELVTHVPFLLG